MTKREVMDVVRDYMMLPYHEQMGLLREFGVPEKGKESDMEYMATSFKKINDVGRHEEFYAGIIAATEKRKAQGWDARPARKEMQTTRLLPCPFCGNKDRINGHFVRDGYSIGCANCYANVRAYSPDCMNKAIIKWNSRVEAE